VVELPAGPLAGLGLPSVGAVIVNEPVATFPVLVTSVAAKVKTPGGVPAGTVIGAVKVKAPVGPADPPARAVVVGHVVPADAVHVTATKDPGSNTELLVPVTGFVALYGPELVMVVVDVSVSVPAAAAALPRLARDAAAGTAAASGPATNVGRLLISSAAVTANAVKLLRSEYKVPSSSER